MRKLVHLALFLVAALHASGGDLGLAGKIPGPVRLTYAGTSNHPFVLQTSTNLENWIQIGSGPDGGSTNFTVFKAKSEARFFRALETQYPLSVGLALTADTNYVYLGEGTLFDAAGAPIPISGSKTQLLPLATNFVVINLADRRPYCLRRAIDSGSVLIGTISISNGIPVCEKISNPELPQTGLPLTKLAMTSGERFTINLFGDSLTAGAGSGVMWWDLLWNEQYSGFGFNVENPLLPSIKNYGIGGVTAEYTLSEVETVLRHRGAPQLALIAIGVNNGRGLLKEAHPFPYFAPCVEDAVRNLTEAGTEVLLVTENSGNGDPTYGDYIGEDMAVLARHYGCSVADTWAYVDRVNLLGSNTFFDSVHQTQDGWNEWARAVRGCLSSNASRTILKGQDEVIEDRVLEPLIPGEESRLFDFAPFLLPVYWSNAVYLTTNVLSPDSLPILNGLQHTNATLAVSTGGFVWFQMTNWVACAIACERGSGAGSFSGTLDILNESGVPILSKGVSFTDSHFGGGYLISLPGLLTISDTAPFSDPESGIVTNAVRLSVTNGLARVLGIIAFERSR